MRKLSGMEFIGAVALIIVGVRFITSDSTGDDPASSSSPFASTSATTAAIGDDASAKEAPSSQPVVHLSAGELFEAYEANEVATDERLAGKLIEVSGRIQSIDKNVWGSIYVGLRTSNQFMPANMFVEASEKPKIVALRKGQRVVFQCKKMMRWVGSPAGDDCVLISAK